MEIFNLKGYLLLATLESQDLQLTAAAFVSESIDYSDI